MFGCCNMTRRLRRWEVSFKNSIYHLPPFVPIHPQNSKLQIETLGSLNWIRQDSLLESSTCGRILLLRLVCTLLWPPPLRHTTTKNDRIRNGVDDNETKCPFKPPWATSFCFCHFWTLLQFGDGEVVVCCRRVHPYCLLWLWATILMLSIR